MAKKRGEPSLESDPQLHREVMHAHRFGQMPLLLQAMADRLERGEPLPPWQRDFLVEALREIADGHPADKVFGVHRKPGAPRRRSILGDIDIAAQVLELRKRGDKMEVAVMVVAERCVEKSSTVKRLYIQYKEHAAELLKYRSAE